MSVMMDYIMSAIIFGVLAIIVARIQINISSTLYDNTFNLQVQGNAVALAMQVEKDFLKMGFKVDPTSGNQITLADTTRVTFNSDWLNDGSIVSVSYRAGDSTEASSTLNVHDFPLYRDGFKQNWGLTHFQIAYYDSSLTKLSTPVSAANRLKIKAIQVWFTIQSPEPVISNIDTTWPAVTWQKMMYPRNLNNFL
ncbi:MAG: hypothetical protein ABIH23_10205 [bacterium]